MVVVSSAAGPGAELKSHRCSRWCGEDDLELGVIGHWVLGIMIIGGSAAVSRLAGTAASWLAA